MSQIDCIVLELQHEASITRKVLEAIPESEFGFKPHAKSFSMIELASHVANILNWASPTTDRDELVFDPEAWQPYVAETKADLLRDYDRFLEEAIAAMRGASDEQLAGMWRLTVHGQTIVEMPRSGVLHGFILNHQIHHRGQLTVYLRLVDAPVPQVYGPSADYPEMAAAE